MSRAIAQLVGKDEPGFYHWLNMIEKSSGMPGADIRLSLKIAKEARQKINELGLDPADTTGRELYSALQVRLKSDEQKIIAGLGLKIDASPHEILAKLVEFIQQKEQASDVLTIKPSVIKRIIKKLKPKQVMKGLGYRSLDSMLKHESVAQLLAAAEILETQEWHQKRLAEYKKLSISDFELKRVHFVLPNTKKWPKIAEDYTEKYRHNVLAIHEVGAVVVLPLHIELLGLAIATTSVCVQALNDIRASSAYLKLHQVRPDIGEVIAAMADEEWSKMSALHGQDIGWGTLHWFYGSQHNADSHPELFEPHVQPDDMQLHETEVILSELNPDFKFWQGTHFLGILDEANKAVSMNVLDVALGVCNALGYPDRVVQSMQKMLSRELMGHYLSHQVVHAQVTIGLNDQLAPEPAFN